MTSEFPKIGESKIVQGVRVETYARATLPTRFGEFELYVFRSDDAETEHMALVSGDVRGQAGVLTRLHSECATGDILGSLRCDCREQLELSLKAIHEAPAGILLYVRQEGRGIGLGNKIRAYALQEQGLDTYRANEHLGFGADMRDYRAAAAMLALLGPASVVLATNNPQKMDALKDFGIDVVDRFPVVAPGNEHNEPYLKAKAGAGHLL